MREINSLNYKSIFKEEYNKNILIRRNKYEDSFINSWKENFISSNYKNEEFSFYLSFIFKFVKDTQINEIYKFIRNYSLWK